MKHPLLWSLQVDAQFTKFACTLQLCVCVQVWERMNITVEPGAACTVAAVLSPKFKELAGPGVKRVGVVLCGGNMDLDNLPWMQQSSVVINTS